MLWRTLLQQRRQAGQRASFFHASRTSLLVLFVLAVIYVKVARTAASEMLPWLTSPGLWPAVVRIAGAIDADHHARGRAYLSLMVVRRAMTGFLRLLSGLFRRSPAMMGALRLRKPPVSLRCCLPLRGFLRSHPPSLPASTCRLIECRQGVAEQGARWRRWPIR